MPICALAEIKSDWLNIPSNDNSVDRILARFIESAQTEIEDLCAQPIVAQTVTFYLPGTTDTLLPTGYTVPMTIQSVASRAAYSDTFAAITGTATVVPVDGVQYLATTDNWTATEYRIVATLGFATVPRIVQTCAAELVVEMFMNTAHNPSGSRFGVSAVSENAGGVSTSRTIKDARFRVMPRLAPYRRVSI